MLSGFTGASAARVLIEQRPIVTGNRRCACPTSDNVMREL